MATTMGERIRDAREAKKISQEELGKACKITKQTIYKYETGIITNIPINKLETIANVLGVSSAYLVGWEESSNEDSRKSVDAADISARLLSDDAFFQTVYRLYQMTPQQFEDASKLLEIAFKKSE